MKRFLQSMGGRVSVLLVSNIAVQMVNFLILPLLSRKLTAAEFGILSLVESIAQITSAVVCLNLHRAVLRFTFDGGGKVDVLAASTAFWGSWLFGGLLAVPSALSFYFLADGLGLADPSHGVLGVGIGLGIALHLTQLALFQSRNKIPAYALTAVAKALLVLAGTALALLYLDAGVTGQLWVLVIANFGALFLGMTRSLGLVSFSLERRTLGEAVAYSAPMIGVMLSAWLLTAADRWLLLALASPDELGRYAMAFKASMVFVMLANAFSVILTPIFFEQIEKNRDHVLQIIRATILLLVLASVFGYVLMPWLAPPVFGNLYPDLYLEIRMLLIARVLGAILMISSVLVLSYLKKSLLNLLLHLAAGLFHLAISYIMIEKIGLWGAVIAGILSAGSLLLTHNMVARYYMVCDFGIPRALALGGLLIAAVHGIESVVEPGDWRRPAALSGLLLPVAAVAAGMVGTVLGRHKAAA